MDKKNIFPRDFFWGASTASHQVEGNTENQWTTWELQHASELAKTAHKRLHWLPIWDEIKKEAEDPNNYVSGKGVDHYNRYKEDFGIVKKLNMNAFRFGIEWSRLEPEEGKWNEEVVEHYRQYIHELNELGIEPFLNIWHWTNPAWFEEKGAFKRRSNLKYFERFVQKIADEYGNKLRYILTINEPNNYTVFGYFTKDTSSGMHWPPGEESVISMARVYWNLVGAHKRAYKILKSSNPALQVGVAAHLGNIQAKRPHNIFDELSTKLMRYFWNWWFLKRIRKQQDFIGINYYFTDYYTGLVKRRNPTTPLNDLGWYMEPEGLYPLMLRAWAHFKKPIIITENGVADMHDQYRQWWLEETIIALERALSEGIDVRGYIHWSLLDNFEWSMGWWPKFGLVDVDRKHDMKRTIRPSAHWFAKRIEELRR